jgi:quercetin dioxygenase-like cupin family protein
VRVYTGEDGKSHLEDLAPPFQSFVDTEGAYGEGTPMEDANGMTIRIAQPGYLLEWHCAPRRQYTITLSGVAEVEVSDGTKRQVGAGDVLLAEDLTGEGHITRVISEDPRYYIVVALGD